MTVQTQEEKDFIKQQRKDAKKYGRMTDDEKGGWTSNGQDLRIARERQLENASAPVPLKKAVKEVVYPNVYRSSEKTNVFGKQTLPMGTIRKEDDSRYDEIIIPFPEKNMKHEDNLISIGCMEDEFCKSAFVGYKSLNRVQSLVYPIAYKTNENMLICAPTGAGKVFLCEVMDRLTWLC